MCPPDGNHRRLRLHLRELIGTRTIVTVSGAHKGVGKTALSEILLRSLSNFAAIKITITDKAAMVTDDEQELMIPATDTWRMKNSGAVKVVWVRSSEDHLLDSLKHALGKIVSCRGILIEGNSILRYLDPTLSLFVVATALGTMKPSRVRALEKADICVINQISKSTPDTGIVEDIRSHNPALIILAINLLNPTCTNGDDYTRLLTLLNERIS